MEVSMTETELMIVIITFCFSLPNQQREGLNGDSKVLLCHADAGTVLHQLSYQVNWELVVMWVDYKPVEVNVDDVYTRICI